MDSTFPVTINLLVAGMCFLALWCTIFYTEVVIEVLNRFFILPMFCWVTNIRKSKSHQKNKTMASSSSLTLLAPPSSLPHIWVHHVFPSFHGADVRTNFLSHVLKELRSKGIDLFIDNNLERSKSIGPALIEAIRGSKIAIVFLSKNYASSTWCLNELLEIMKCREEFGQTVVPLFYQVDPTDIKKQTGDFGKVFRKTYRGKTKEEIRRWKRALTEVAQIAGFHSTNGKPEAEMIEDIATDVSNKLNLSAPCSDFDGLVGMESHMTKLGPLLRLDSDDVRKIGILGPRGIGKTTIARFLFNRHSPDFRLSVFMDSIKQKHAIMACSDDYGVKLDLQKQFMYQLTNEKDIKVSHPGVIKDRLKDKKVLVVLDDVDRSVQLEAMAKENSWFGAGSRIIITTQNQNVLKASGIDYTYRVNLPSENEGFQMFSMYAFGQKRSKHIYNPNVWKVRCLAGDLPLGLRVMGSYFQGISPGQDWIEALSRLNTNLDQNEEIASVLKLTYDTLHDEEKSLFLHIACFFAKESVDIVESCLATCFYNVTQGLHILVKKYQIHLYNGYIEMAELLVQLGRKIMREEHVSEPGKRRFLHDAKEIEEVLNDDKTGSSNVRGIDLNEDITCTSERAFERLSKLQFLRINGLGINPQSMNYIPKKLRVLSWRQFQLTCFPSSFNPNFLVKLEMQYSGLKKLWEGTQSLSNLKWMDLSESKRLKKLPDLSTATNLYDLNLCGCLSLVELPFSIGNAINLQQLNLSFCSSLVKLPSSIGNAINLIKLHLSGCSSLVDLPSSIGNAINLRFLVLIYCISLVKLPSSIGNAINLEVLNLSNCSSLVDLPASMRNLGRLSRLYLQNCSKLEVNLANINFESLEELDLSDCFSLKSYSESSTDTQELDSWRGRISRLRHLKLSGMKKLVSLPQLPNSVVELDAEDCESLKRLDCSFRNPGIRLNFLNCFQLNQEAKDLIIQTPTTRHTVFPGGEVPKCFPYQSYGSSLTVKLNQTPLGKSTKFMVCICAGEGRRISEWGYVGYIIKSKGNIVTSAGKRVDSFFPGHLYTFEVEVETKKLTSKKLVFEFGYLQKESYNPESPDTYQLKKLSNMLEIKQCGITPGGPFY
ncbi:probable disease resistance protein RPP1 [Raphanus sativus]|uniref:ADP-ribosyl cyclase/cyclic ADP-ribose hydrolase n=1 Tax=Raphanus sativus TaxID=3726 RepID=A0A9W3CRF9_RAPSA|nr:probable disease resistance protein RPP1 [Raphanus sativus]